MRGELETSDTVSFNSAGSSPHAWGTRLPSLIVHGEDRFILTCVGNSLSRRCPLRPLTVHPHMRGELNDAWAINEDTFGSSPHTWGTPRLDGTECVPVRFIPTYVGNSFLRQRERQSDPVHPHMREELASPSMSIPGNFGSSPHAWGTLITTELIERPLRFIPTYVGNSERCEEHGSRVSVHPHIRGELMALMRSSPSDAGSSPHAWGTRRVGDSRHGFGRFIPTCVGNPTM